MQSIVLDSLKVSILPDFYFYFRDRKEELEGEVFEILLTFSDFMSFKEMLLDYRAVSIVETLFIS